MKRPEIGHLNVIRLCCPICKNNWDQKVVQTGLIEAPCLCSVTMSMEVVTGFFGKEWIHTLFSITRALGVFSHDKGSLSVEDQKIADSGMKII